MNYWTDERVAILRELYPLPQWSAREIADHLGGISRNSVIGKARRLGLDKPHQEKRKPEPERKVVSHNMEPTRPASVNQDQPVRAPSDSVTFENLRDHHCRYIVGDIFGWDTPYCGRNRLEGSSYCPEHHDLTTNPAYRPTGKGFVMYRGRAA